MLNVKILWSALFPLLGLTALSCSQNVDSSISDYTTVLGSHTTALRSEEAAHYTSVTAATTLDVVRDRESTHWQTMKGHLDQMRLVIGDMSFCSNGSTGFDTSSLADMMRRVRSDDDEHLARMQAATSLESARAEESHHYESAMGMMDGMMTEVDRMMWQGSMFTCMACSVCGMGM